MKKILGIVLLLSTTASAEPDPELQMRTSVEALIPWHATNVVKFIARQSELTVKFLGSVQTNAVAFHFKAKNLPAKTLLNWSLHFLNANATIDGEVLHIASGSPQPLPPGKPVETSELLARPNSLGHPAGYVMTNSLDDMIEYVLHVAQFRNMVMGPDCAQFETNVKLEANNRSTADIIKDLCDQAGLQCTLHGEVLFIRKKEKKDVPNKALDDTSQ